VNRSRVAGPRSMLAAFGAFSFFIEQQGGEPPPGFAGRPDSRMVMETRKMTNKFSSEARARLVRMARGSCGAITLRRGRRFRRLGRRSAAWRRLAQPASAVGERDPGATTDERERIKALKREKSRASVSNEICEGSAYFAPGRTRPPVQMVVVTLRGRADRKRSLRAALRLWHLVCKFASLLRRPMPLTCLRTFIQ